MMKISHSASFYRIMIVTVCYLLVGFPLVAQRTFMNTDPHKSFRDGMDLFAKEKYGAAKAVFTDILEKNLISDESTRGLATYYRAVCAMELYHPDAEILLLSFLESYPENPKSGMAVFQLGKLYFRQKKWKNAQEWLEKTDADYLSVADLHEYYFKLGYAQYTRKEYDRASQAFYEIKDGDSKYSPAALYYYSHIAYLSNNYQNAITGFIKLKNDPVFGSVVPYYIVQIHFYQGKFDEVISEGSTLLKTEGLSNKIDIIRIVAESYYKTARYKEAIPYFEEYHSKASSVSKEDHYQTGFCYMQNNQCSKAIFHFEKAAEGSGLTTQHALIHLGSCFVKTGNKQSARNAFQAASRIEESQELREEALFNYAKLSFELNFQPVAIKTFEDFLKTYPNSQYFDQASELIAQAFITTRNYKDALRALENIRNRSLSARSAYQKCAYYRALELYNDGEFKAAIGLLDKAIANPVEAGIIAQARYWKGESLYRLNNYDAAIKSYEDFAITPTASGISYFNLANYNIGYCYFKKEDYENALSWFRKYLRNKGQTDKHRYNDGLLRAADSYFVLKDYINAVEFYNNAITAKAKASDYAVFQKGIIMGVQGNNNEKASSMLSLVNQYPGSAYADDAIYEAAEAYLALGEFSKALNQYNKILESYPGSSYAKKAILGSGLVYYNMKEDGKALASYKKVVELYPSSPEASQALVGMRVIYVNAGNVNEYLEYVKNVPTANVSLASQDSLIYQGAESRYMRNDCPGAIADFTSYLDRFPNGFYSINANFYRAECFLRSGNLEKAIEGYAFVVSKSRNTFTEKSLLSLGNLASRREDWKGALAYYEKLEPMAEVRGNLIDCRIGLVRVFFKLDRYKESISAAEKLIAMEKLPGEILHEARLYYGKSAYETGDFAVALRELLAVSRITNSERGAEGKYLIGLIQYKQGHFKDSQKTIFELINQIPAYDYWIASGFILLADNYLALGDTFQAKHTYQSILDNYEGEDLKEIAREKLKKISGSVNRTADPGKENQNPEIIEE